MCEECEQYDSDMDRPGSFTRRFTRIDLVVAGLDFLFNVAGDVAACFGQLRNVAAMHANYQSSQHDFAVEAALEIERITEGEAD